MMLVGLFLVRPIPLPEQTSSKPLEDGDDVREALLPALQRHSHSRTTLLNDDIMKDRHAQYTRTDIDAIGEYSNSVGVTDSIHTSDRKRKTLNIHGKALCRSLNFWLLFSLFSMRMFFSSPALFLMNVLYYKDSLWIRLYMYVLNLSDCALRLYCFLLPRYKQCWVHVALSICSRQPPLWRSSGVEMAGSPSFCHQHLKFRRADLDRY